MSRVLLRAAVSTVLLSASDARKVKPDGQVALISTGIKLRQQATAAADDAVKEAEAELAKEMSSAEPEEEKVVETKKQKKIVKKKVADADDDFVADGDDEEDYGNEEDDEEGASGEEDDTEDKAEKKDKDDEKEGAAKKDDAKKTATKDSKKETAKAAKKDDEKKETTKAAKKEGEKEEEDTEVSKEDDKRTETPKGAKKDDKRKESTPVAKSDAEPKKGKDANSDKKKDDKADAKNATEVKKTEAAKQDKTKQSGKEHDEKEKEVADEKPENETTENETTEKDNTSSEAETQNKTVEEERLPMPKFGTPKCPCVGLEGTKGNLTVSFGANKTASYPAEAFASCAAWDADSHPACKKAGDGTRWCQEPWCLVDPCNCEIDIAPKKVTGGYWPDGDLQGMGGYWYSYATCGGEDIWADEDSQKKMTDEPKECDKNVEETKWGDSRCQCIGVAGRQGNVDVEISDNVTVRYPVDAGATCRAWDMEHHPDCQGKHPADWCTQVWCYVDPCSCAIPVSPKVSNYMKDATWSGRPVYYSYNTCGGNDTYTESQENACVNQQTDEECGNQSRCAWDGQQCLGKELVKVCKKAAKADAQVQAELDEAAEEEKRTAAKTPEKSGALLSAAPLLATILTLVASSS